MKVRRREPGRDGKILSGYRRHRMVALQLLELFQSAEKEIISKQNEKANELSSVLRKIRTHLDLLSIPQSGENIVDSHIIQRIHCPCK